MFERFTQEARMTIVLAHQEAEELGHDFIGTEHLVLAASPYADLDRDELRAEVTAVSDADALAAIGIDLDEVRERTEATFGEGALSRSRKRRRGRVPFTKRAKAALELAVRESVELGDGEIGTKHLLLGVLREGDGLGARLLADHGVTAEALRVR